MVRHFSLIAGLLFSMQVIAQTGIGTTTPDPSAKLEINASNKGFLPPRVTLTSVTDATTIPSPATGLLIYNTGNNVGLAAGYYFWNGNTWATIATAGGSGSVAAEFGSQFLGSNVNIPGSTSSSSATTLISFTLPSAGTWEIISFVRVYLAITNSACEFGIFDANGILVPNSEILVDWGASGITGTGVIQVNTTGSSLYSLRAWSNSSGAAINVDGNGRTGAAFKKISGNSPMTVINYGDIKTGIQSADHHGWVKLDGRSKSSLTSTQQLQATTLGISNNLPDATNAVLMQSSGSLGDVTGSMSKTLTQSQLPNITPIITVNNTTATMQNAGAHDHPVNVVPSSTGGYAAGNPYAFKNGMAPSPMNETYADITDRGNSASYITTGIIGSAGNHSHVIDAHSHAASMTSINGGVTQQAIDITPRKLIVNTFIYLGY
jgi:hypothetical protein